MALNTLQYTGVLTINVCYKCHIQFAIPVDMDERCQQDHRITFYCPAGHGQVYTGKTDLQKARDEADGLRANLRYARSAAQAARDQADAAHRSAAAHKGHATRLRNLISKGICPCCRRNFSNVREHMASEHPGFAVPGPTEPTEGESDDRE